MISKGQHFWTSPAVTVAWTVVYIKRHAAVHIYFLCLSQHVFASLTGVFGFQTVGSRLLNVPVRASMCCTWRWRSLSSSPAGSPIPTSPPLWSRSVQEVYILHQATLQYSSVQSASTHPSHALSSSAQSQHSALWISSLSPSVSIKSSTCTHTQSPAQ